MRNIILQLQTVFSLKLPEYNPKLEDFLTEKISKFAFDPSNINFQDIFIKENKPTNDDSEKFSDSNDTIENDQSNLIKNKLFLKLEDRFELLSFLNENSIQNDSSTTNKLIFSTLYLQSFSSLFFIDFNSISNENSISIEKLDLFIQSLSQSLVLNPDLFEIAYRSYSIFYEKVGLVQELNDTFLEILNHADNFLMLTKKIPTFFVPFLVKISIKLLHFSEKISNEEEKEKNSIIKSHFETASKVLQESLKDKEFTQEEITNISEFFTLSANFAIFYNFNELSQVMIRLCFELSIFSGVSFKQIIPLFENVIQQNEFGDSEIYEVDFKNISEFASKAVVLFNEENFSHKFESLFNILSQIQNKKILLPIVFSMTKENIMNGNLNDFLFLLLFINKKFVDDKEMVDFLKQQLNDSKTDLFSILIPESFYQSTIFDDINNKNLLLLKCVGLNTYQKLAKVNLKLYNSLFELFSRLKNNEKSFTELLIISLPILMNNYLPDDFFKDLKFAFDNFTMYECIKATTDFLFEIYNSKTFLYSSFNSIEANLFFCQFLNQRSFEDVGKNFYLKLFEFLAETPQKAPYFEPFLTAVKQIKQRCHFFELFYEIIDSLKKSVLRFITKGILFELIQDTIMNYSNENGDECFDIMFKLLEFYYFNNSHALFLIDWLLITNQIIKTRKNKLSTNMHNSILKILSDSPTFNGIRYKEPTPLIKIILYSEEFSKDFLQKLYQAITNNSVQLLAFYQFGINKMLLDFIIEIISHTNSLDNDEIFDLIMKIVVLVNSYICDRETIEKFLSVFHHLDISNKDHYNRIPKYLKYFEESMNENNLSPSYALRFDSLTSSILLPSPPINCFSFGLTLYVNLLIPYFKSLISLISFISTNSFLSVYLGQKKIVVSSNHYSRPIIIPVEIPRNEWFDLKIHFKSLGEVYVQLNNNQIMSDSSQSSCKPFPSTPIGTSIMFKSTNAESHLKNVEGLLTKILLYIGPFKQNFFAGDINDPSLFALFTPRFTDSKNHLKNLAYNYEPPDLQSSNNNQSLTNENVRNVDENNDAVYCANCESYLPTFSKVFTSFSGLNDFIIFFSYKGIDVNIIQSLFSTLKFLLKGSNDLQKQMFEINGFYLITHFIKDIDPNSLTVDFWNNIIEFETIITNMEVMKNYFDALLLSFKPYLYSDESVLFKVMKKWSQIEPNFFLSCITFPLFCQIIYQQFHERKVSGNIKTLLIQIMVNVSRLFGQKEMSLLSELIGKMSIDDLDSAMTMFQAVRAITTSYPKLHDVSINIMLNDERLMHSKHPEILCAILQLFAQRNLKYLALLLKTQMAIPRDYSEINHFLTHFCGVFTGKSFKNLDDINDIDFSDHTIYLPVLPFILSFSFQSSSNQIGKVSKFLIKIFSDQICVQYIATSINPLTLFLLISYAIVLSNDLVKFLIDIISANIDLYADAYQIIDILSDEMNQGFHDYQNAIACSVILKIKERKQKETNINVSKMIDIIINSICFGINRSVFDFAKCSSVFIPKEKGTRRSSSYVKSPKLKKAEANPNTSSIPSLKINSSENDTENSFPKLKTSSNENENSFPKLIESSNINKNSIPEYTTKENDTENSFPKLTESSNINENSITEYTTKENDTENSFPKLTTSSNINNKLTKENDDENSIPKFNTNNNNFKIVNDINSSNSESNLNDSIDQSTKSTEIKMDYSINSTSVTSLTPLNAFPHSVSLDLSHVQSRDRRSSLVHQQSPELLYSLSFFIRKKFVLNQIFEKLKENKFKNKRNSFGLIYKNKDVWADMKTAELLMSFLNESSLPQETSIQLCVMLSFLCHEQLFSSKKIDFILNQVAERYNLSDSFLAPLLNEVSFRINDFKNAHFFLSKFESALSPSVKLYEESTEFMKQFVCSLHPISNVSEKLAQLFSFEMEEIQIMDIDSYFLDLEQKELTKNNLRERMFRKLRPIYTESTRRFNLIDNHFRPFLLTNTEQLNYKILDIPQVQEHFAQHEIWSAKCQRVKLYTKIPGDFIITKDGIRFSTTKGKSLFILRTSVRCIFWNYYHHLPNSFSFTTLKGKTFLFRFIKQYVDNEYEDEEKENEKFGYERKIYLTEGESTVIYAQTATREEVITNLKKIELPNCVFFQDSEPSIEIERLDLTQQWRTREISNFDYILWLNMLSGRSFLDIESYPIFPILLISDEDQSLVRDLSKTVSLSLSSDNNNKLRERKLSDLDPYKTFLFSKTSSTPEIIKRFLYSIEQFRVGDNARISNEELFDSKSEIQDSKSSDSLDKINKEEFMPFTSYSQIINEIKNGNLHCELPPEFFFMPEFLKNWTEFPKYASNASAFVMKNLETLESEEVSLSIHKWIDMIWGVSQNFNCFIDPDLSPNVWNFNLKKSKKNEENKTKQKKTKKRWLKNSLNETKPVDKTNSKKNEQNIERNKKIHEKLSKNGQIPIKLFVGPHPARGTCNIIQTKHTSFNLNSLPYVRSIGVRFTNNKTKEFEIFLFHENELITKFQCKANKFNLGIRIPYDFHHFQHVSFTGSFLCFVILGTKSLFAFDFDKNQLLIGSESPHLKQISCIDSSSSSSYFASGSTDSSVVAWMISEETQTAKPSKTAKIKMNGAINPFNGKLIEMNDENNSSLTIKKIVPFRTLTAHRRPIVKVKIQDEMRILLAIDDLGIMSISVFPYLKLIKTIDTKIENCDSLLMTRNSLVCFKGREAFNFTANGTKNGNRKFNFDIVCVESIESRTRTDIIAISTSINEIISINSVSLKAVSILEHHTSCIIQMKYNSDIDALICYTESKKILIVPISD